MSEETTDDKAIRLWKARYLKQLPKLIPEGQVLVHNKVRPSRRQGWRGARYWLQNLSELPPLEVCECGWCSDLGPHYRVVTQWEGGSNDVSH
jgi:hypothetical protein